MKMCKHGLPRKPANMEWVWRSKTTWRFTTKNYWTNWYRLDGALPFLDVSVSISSRYEPYMDEDSGIMEEGYDACFIVFVCLLGFKAEARAYKNIARGTWDEERSKQDMRDAGIHID